MTDPSLDPSLDPSPNAATSPLDHSAAAMAGAQGADADLQFYHLFAETQLVLLLQSEAAGADLQPMLFDLPTGRVILAFDSEDRLGDFAASMGQGALPYAALPGRILAGLIAAQDGMALGLNFGAGTASEMVLPHGAMVWLAEMLDVAPVQSMGQIVQVLPMTSAPPALLAALTRGLLGAGALAQRAVLAKLAYDSGAQAHVLAFFGVAEAAQPPLARAVAEALAFSGIEAAALDVIFLQDGPTAQAILARGQDIALPQPAQPEAPPTRPAPGMDKNAPPKLR